MLYSLAIHATNVSLTVIGSWHYQAALLSTVPALLAVLI